MTALLAFLRIAWPYLLTAAAGAFISHEIGNIRYDALQTALESYKAQEADKDAAAQKATADALQAQIKSRLATEANNGKVISQLQSDRDAAIAARDFSNRLLAAAAKAHPASSAPVPTPAGGSAPDAAAQPSGSGQLAQLLRDAAAETAQCFEHYTGLQVELQPQLRTP